MIELGGKDNLIPQAHILSVEEQSLGGKKSAEKRRQNKSVKEIFQKLLTTDLSQQQMQQILKQFPGLEDNEVNYKTAIGIEQIRKALKGDMNAAKFVFDYAGEKPKEEIDADVKIPIFNINEKKTDDMEKEFEKYM